VKTKTDFVAVCKLLWLELEKMKPDCSLHWWTGRGLEVKDMLQHGKS